MPITTGDRSGGRFIAMRFAAKGILALLLFASCATALCAQTIQIKLVNGKTGHPVTSIPWLSPHNVYVGFGRESDLSLVLTTDRRGVSRLRFTRDDSEVNTPDCKGKRAAWNNLVKNSNKNYIKKFNKKYKNESDEFDKKYKNCTNFLAKNPVVRFTDSISIGIIVGDGSLDVLCWANFSTFFSTEEILQHGVVTANNCGKATASPLPGQLILFVRPPTIREEWRQAW